MFVPSTRVTAPPTPPSTTQAPCAANTARFVLSCVATLRSGTSAAAVAVQVRTTPSTSAEINRSPSLHAATMSVPVAVARRAPVVSVHIQMLPA